MYILLCKPLQVYIVLFIIFTVVRKLMFSYKMPLISEIISSIIGFGVNFSIIYLLCKYKYNRTAWVLVLGPVILSSALLVAFIPLKIMLEAE